MLAAIRQWVIKTMMKGNTGVVQSLPKQEIIEMNVQITAERIMRNGINPNDLKTVGQVENVVNQIEQPKVNVNPGLTSVKKADVLDMEGNTISEGSKIIGGKQIKPIDELEDYNPTSIDQKNLNKELMKTDNPYSELVNTPRPRTLAEREADVLAGMEKNNKEMVQRIRDRKNKPLDPNDVLPDYNETPGAFTRRNTPGSKENLLQELKIAYEKDFNRLRGDETVEELQSILKDLNKNGEPFADGGRIGYKVGSKGKAVEGLLNLIRNKFGKKAATTADKLPIPPKTRDRNMFKAADDRFKDKRMLDEDEIAELDLDIGGLEYTNDFDGTVGSANKLRKERAEYIADMELEYKKGNLDPKPGEANRQRFLQKKFDEMQASGDTRLMTIDEIEELSSFDLQIDMDEAVEKFKKKDAEQKKIIEDFDPGDRDSNATGGRVRAASGGLADLLKL